MKRIFTIIACFASLSLFASKKLPFSPVYLVISEVYGGGGMTGSPYQNDFVEIYNTSGTTVVLDGLSVQYAATSGLPSAAQTVLLSGTLGPYQYYLIKFGPASAVGAPLPTFNASNSTNLLASNGKVFLFARTTSVTSCFDAFIIDMVGYGLANCSETAPAPSGSAQLSIKRNLVTGDSGNNSADFTTGSPTPLSGATVVAVSEIYDFTASKSGNNTALNWAINCTTSSLTMELQRSSNARDFSTFYSEQADQARCLQPFTATDHSVNKGVNYYRLKVKNSDGEISYSNIASLKFGGNEDIKVIPTIANAEVHVFYEASVAGKSTWTVYDMSGRSVNNTSALLIKGQNNITVNISNLRKGQYQISGVTPAGRSTSVTFLKQ